MTTPDPLAGPFPTGRELCDYSNDEGYAIPISLEDVARYQTLLQEG